MQRQRGKQQLRALVDHGEAYVDVVQVHVRGLIVPHVLHLVVDLEPRLPEPGFDAASQEEVLPEDRGLQNFALGL
jgi:hypothetical protein